MNIKTKRQINREKMEKKYMAVYKDIEAGYDWKKIAKKYHYKNGESARATYYRYVVPFITFFNR